MGIGELMSEQCVHSENTYVINLSGPPQSQPKVLPQSYSHR